MFPRLRFAVSLVTALLLYGAVAHSEDRPKPAEDDRVYRYRTKEGREVFTNAGRVAVGGAPLTPLALPELSNLDFAEASPTQLRQLDQSVQRAYEELQSGARCEAIRASLRVPLSTFLWREHLRELSIAALLVATALVVSIAWTGHLRTLMPIAPLLGALYLGYATYTRVEQRLEALRAGLRACSTELPSAESASASAVKARFESAVTLQATIDSAYTQRAAMAERSLRER